MYKTFTFLFLTALFFNAQAQTLVDFEEFTIPQDSALNGSDNNGGFTSGTIFLSNSYNPMFNSWSGWAISNNTDTLTPGFNNQFSSITGSGFDGSSNYAVTFAGSDTSFINTRGAAVGGTFDGMYITNSTYTYLSVLNGDSFAKKFGGEDGNDKDFLFITIKKFKDGQVGADSIDFYLADYRFDDNTMDYIVDEWTFIDLKPLGDADSLMIIFSSSDVGMFGINSPKYFCMDNLTTLDQTTSTVENELAINWSVAPNPATDYLRIELPDNIRQAQVQLFAADGRLVQTAWVNEQQSTLDLRAFPAGVYHLSLIYEQQLQTITIIKQ